VRLIRSQPSGDRRDSIAGSMGPPRRPNSSTARPRYRQLNRMIAAVTRLSAAARICWFSRPRSRKRPSRWKGGLSSSGAENLHKDLGHASSMPISTSITSLCLAQKSPCNGVYRLQVSGRVDVEIWRLLSAENDDRRRRIKRPSSGQRRRSLPRQVFTLPLADETNCSCSVYLAGSCGLL
jgi:hypothetical protein